MSSNAKPQPGDMVLLTGVPPGLLDGLPSEDQQAITDVIGRPVLLTAYDDIGRAELEFVDAAGIIHYLYVDASVIRAID